MEKAESVGPVGAPSDEDADAPRQLGVEEPVINSAGSGGMKRFQIKPWANATCGPDIFAVEVDPKSTVKELRAAIAEKSGERSFRVNVRGVGDVKDSLSLSDIPYDAKVTMYEVKQRTNEQLAVLSLRTGRTRMSLRHGTSPAVQAVMQGLGTAT